VAAHPREEMSLRSRLVEIICQHFGGKPTLDARCQRQYTLKKKFLAIQTSSCNLHNMYSFQITCQSRRTCTLVPIMLLFPHHLIIYTFSKKACANPWLLARIIFGYFPDIEACMLSRILMKSGRTPICMHKAVPTWFCGVESCN
jgi:hypothetical protein